MVGDVLMFFLLFLLCDVIFISQSWHKVCQSHSADVQPLNFWGLHIYYTP